MKLSWADKAWEDYLYWQQTDKKILKRVNRIIKDIQRKPFEGIGDPEPLRFNCSAFGTDHDKILLTNEKNGKMRRTSELSGTKKALSIRL